MEVIKNENFEDKEESPSTFQINDTQGSKCYQNTTCECTNPNCQGNCRCNCKPNLEDTQNSMCNGVFAPICEPEVCDIPRFPHHQNLVVGVGIFVQNPEEEKSKQKIYGFIIYIYREFFDYFGKFILFDHLGTVLMESEKLECYHAKTEDKMIAIFHETLADATSREVTVYAKPATSEYPAAVYVYSAPLFDEEFSIGSNLLRGEITIMKDMTSHDH